MRTPSPASHLIVLAPAALHREAWRALLSAQPGIAIAGGAGSVSAVTALLRPGLPTTILVDLASPHPAVVAELRQAAPECGLLLLVSSYEFSEVIPLLRAGATGCVSREDSVGDLARAVIAAGRGEIVLPPSIAARALAALARGGPVSSASGSRVIEALSERESDVLRALARGLTNKDIAQTLIVSVRTVEAHLRSIYGKLGVHSRTEAALWAVKHGYGPDAQAMQPTDGTPRTAHSGGVTP